MTHQKIYRMATSTGIFSFILMFINTYSCTVTKNSVNICCKDIYANGTYKYSANTNWTTNKLQSEEWDSDNVLLAFTEYSPFLKNSSAEVEQILSGSIYLKRCLNLTYSATDDIEEIHIHFIVTGCTEEEQNNASKVTSNLDYLAVLVPIIGLLSILGIEWKFSCLRQRFLHRRNGRRQPVDDRNIAEEDSETFRLPLV